MKGISIGRGMVSSAWRDSFVSREGEEIEYFRCLVTVNGEKPMQLKVRNAEQFEEIRQFEGVEGEIYIEIDCEPGRRQQIAIDRVE